MLIEPQVTEEAVLGFGRDISAPLTLQPQETTVSMPGCALS